HVVFGKTVPDVSLNAVANLGYAAGVFGAPVYPGDTLTTTSEVIGLKENSNGAHRRRLRALGGGQPGRRDGARLRPLGHGQQARHRHAHARIERARAPRRGARSTSSSFPTRSTAMTPRWRARPSSGTTTRSASASTTSTG
ncbi:MAG: hypothetical protein V9F04_17930, partial [Dermatophilaceae bacterium]